MRRFTCTVETTPADLIGSHHLIDGKPVFVLSPLLESYHDGTPITLVATGALTAHMAILLAMLLDDAGPLTLTDGRALSRHPDFRVELED